MGKLNIEHIQNLLKLAISWQVHISVVREITSKYKIKSNIKNSIAQKMKTTHNRGQNV